MQHIGISLMQVKKIVLCHKRWITFMIMLLLLYHHTELPVDDVFNTLNFILTANYNIYLLKN